MSLVLLEKERHTRVLMCVCIWMWILELPVYYTLLFFFFVILHFFSRRLAHPRLYWRQIFSASSSVRCFLLARLLDTTLPHDDYYAVCEYRAWNDDKWWRRSSEQDREKDHFAMITIRQKMIFRCTRCDSHSTHMRSLLLFYIYCYCYISHT